MENKVSKKACTAWAMKSACKKYGRIGKALSSMAGKRCHICTILGMVACSLIVLRLPTRIQP
eukprot:1156980-Pelagomonas_calceolata.AAC.11